MQDFILSNHLSVPVIGFGTWQVPKGEQTFNAVSTALNNGYRHIDTASAYNNEKSVGDAIKASGIDRRTIFLTTKLWNKDRGYTATLNAFERSLELLQTDYLDLYLIHWPANSKQFDNWKAINAETWRAFEDLYRQGKVRAIGVSNFMVKHLEALKETAALFPMVNQIEYHPGYTQDEVVSYCKREQVLVEAWSPIGSGRLLNHELLRKIAEKYKTSVAQLCIRFCLQNEILPLPKSVTPAYIKANLDVEGFTIDASDLSAIHAIKNEGWSGLNPDQIGF
ncbi:oxidoreductase [Niabella ginsenosidivorans]|uniref:Oxidoreductase n=1 Tax=Niabella ginsenosidivorans TaxID=1176587 RepID=A0A1A9I5I3_9BACT|nr:aldo/keto reductase [Niabella ginsenosidivorans]ANH81942.1 oxidoreductase [Niabella ginsenosidivorans]